MQMLLPLYTDNHTCHFVSTKILIKLAQLSTTRIDINYNAEDLLGCPISRPLVHVVSSFRLPTTYFSNYVRTYFHFECVQAIFRQVTPGDHRGRRVRSVRMNTLAASHTHIHARDRTLACLLARPFVRTNFFQLL